MEDKFEDSKGQSEAINQRMTNKAMTKKKKSRDDYKSNTKHTKILGELGCSS